MGVGFFLPISGSGWWVILIKGSLFIVLIAVLYATLFKEEGAAFLQRAVESRSTIEKPALDFVDEAVEEDWIGFGLAFDRFTLEFLTIIRNAIVATSAGFYLNRREGGLVFQSGENEVEQFQRRMFVAEGGLVDHVVKQREPLLEGNLPIGTIMDGMPNTEIRSFLGVPLILNDDVLGVLALGCDATETFGEADRDFLIRCASLFTRVMTVCHRGLRWETDQKVFRVHLEMEKALASNADEEMTVHVFVQYLKKLFPFDRFTLCVRDGDEGVIRHVYGQVDDMDRGVHFPLGAGLNGLIIKRNAPLLIPDLREGSYARPRFTQGEDMRHGLRSYLGIPLGMRGEAWGCLSLESQSVRQYGKKETEVLTALSIPFQTTLERFQLAEELRARRDGLQIDTK